MGVEPGELMVGRFHRCSGAVNDLIGDTAGPQVGCGHAMGCRGPTQPYEIIWFQTCSGSLVFFSRLLLFKLSPF